MNNYDNWKLDNGDNGVEEYECDCCDHVGPDEDFTEINITDADGDKKAMSVCETCLDNQAWI